MALALSTAGIKVKYIVETTAGTRPTTGYTALSGIKSIGDLNPEPSQLDCTPLEEKEWKQYIPGLKDVGGVVSFTANNTDAFQTAWAALVSAAETGIASNKKTWFEIVVPGLANSFYFAGIPSDLGLAAIEVDSVLDVEAYVTPNEIVGWAVKST